MPVVAEPIWAARLLRLGMRLTSPFLALALSLTRAFWPMPAAASQALPVRAAVERALASDPGIRAAEHAVDAARAREVQAGALTNPIFSLTGEEVPIADPAAGTFLAGISVPLALGGIRRSRLQAAEADRLVAELDLEARRRDLAARVKEAAATLEFHEEGLRAAVAAQDWADAALEAAQRRQRAGESAAVETGRAETQAARARTETAIARDVAAGARADLAALLGLEAGSDFRVQLDAAAARPLPPLESLVVRGREARFEVKRREAAVRREGALGAVASAGFWTGSEASLATGMSAGRPALSMSLALPVPLYRQTGEIQEAEFNRLRAIAESEAASRDIALEIGQAYRAAVAAARRADLYRTGLVPQARSQAENALRRFVVGEGSGAELAESRQAYRAAQTELRQAVLDFHRAHAALERAVGGSLE